MSDEGVQAKKDGRLDESPRSDQVTTATGGHIACTTARQIMGMKRRQNKGRKQLGNSFPKEKESSERDDEPEFYRALWPPSQSESQTSNQIHRALVIEEKSGLASRLGDKFRSLNRPKLSLSSKTGSSFLEDSLGNNGQSQKMLETIQDFDEKFRNHRPQHDKTMLKRAMCISTLRVSWNLIEAEICHNPDCFEVGFDIQHYYALHQSLTLEDLAKATSKHTLKGLVKVINKVLKNLENMREVEDYLRFVGRLHDVAGVDPRFLDITGLAFCHALDVLDQKGFHGDIWNSQVKDTWQTFFRVVVRAMKRGYANPAHISKQLALFTEQKSLITEVWATIQDHILHYLSNSLLLPLVMRSNRSILKYFVTYESTISCLNFHGSNGNGTLEKTKHGTWLLTIVLRKVIPNLDNLEACHDYLRDLGAKHQQHGVRREHLDLMALVYCSAIRGVVATQGIKGGPLSETTKAWFCLLRFIVSSMKKGYIDDVQDTSQEISDEETEEDSAGNSKNRQSETDRGANSPLPEVNKQLTSCSTGTVAGTSSRTSSLTSSNEQDFHVMRRRNAYIQMDPGSVGDPQEISGLLQPMPNNLCQKVRQFSLQF